MDRTFPKHFHFGKGQRGRDDLEIVLKVVALKYKGILGYVQGMNFLVATLLYHSSPPVALTLITALLEQYELCNVFKDNLEGLHEHNEIVSKLIESQLGVLHAHFTVVGVSTEMFTTSWILDLFSHIIPLSEYGQFFDFFFGFSWRFFYKLVIQLLSEA